MDNLAIGLITHKKSKYLNEKKEHDEFAKLNNLIKIPRNLVVIKDDDRYDANNFNLNLQDFLKEVIFFSKHLLKMQVNIIRYSKIKSINASIYNGIYSLYTILKIVIRYGLSRVTKKYLHEFQQYAIRQKNISNSHIQMIEQLYKKNAQYVLVLEDDFLISNSDQIEFVLESIISKMNTEGEIKILNLSKSFTERELGIKFNRVKSTKIDKNMNYEIIQYNYFVTNTACALLYKKNICGILINELKNLNHYSFIPIDHKINISLNNLMKRSEINQTCYSSLIPGIFVQGSLHA